MQRWQRLSTFWLFGLCFFSGLIWFCGLDWLHLPVPTLRVWWVSHGATSLLVLVLVGAALPQHLIVTWKARRNLRHGVLVLASLGILLLSALGLMYGPEEWHDGAHWIHTLVGLSGALVFPWHVWRGRRQNSHKKAGGEH
jgi:hypothetical protein